jgi:pyruvate dehydrogenase E1 component alpha subunit
MMLRMRRMEEKVVHWENDRDDLLRGHVHVYIGQEAAGAGIGAALNQEDYLFTTHRNHAHVLAKGGEPRRILAEIIGRSDGYAGGRAGTFHVAAPEIGVMHTSAIVGGLLPLAAGAAYGTKLKGEKRATVACFGDGAMEEGVFYETMNIAQLWKLPVVFYMENNAVTPQERSGRGSPTSEHSATRLSDIPRAFNVETHVIDGTDPEAVFALVDALAEKAREGEGPFFVESRTTRWPGNYGSNPKLLGGDTSLDWAWAPGTAPEPVRKWHTDSDPVLLHARRLVEAGTLTREEIEQMDAEVRAEVEDAARLALESKPLPGEAALGHTYA